MKKKNSSIISSSKKAKKKTGFPILSSSYWNYATNKMMNVFCLLFTQLLSDIFVLLYIYRETFYHFVIALEIT